MNEAEIVRRHVGSLVRKEGRSRFLCAPCDAVDAIFKSPGALSVMPTDQWSVTRQCRASVPLDE